MWTAFSLDTILAFANKYNQIKIYIIFISFALLSHGRQQKKILKEKNRSDRDLNPGPFALNSCTLPTELHIQMSQTISFCACPV